MQDQQVDIAFVLMQLRNVCHPVSVDGHPLFSICNAQLSGGVCANI